MLTKKELADHYKVSITSIDRMMKDGLPYTKFGRSVRFDIEKVEAWLEEERIRKEEEK